MRNFLKGFLGVSAAIMLALTGYYVADQTAFLDTFTNGSSHKVWQNEEQTDTLNLPADELQSATDEESLQGQRSTASDTKDEKTDSSVNPSASSDIQWDDSLFPSETGKTSEADSDHNTQNQLNQGKVQYQSADLQPMKGSGKEASDTDRNLSQGKTGDGYDFDARYYPYYSMLNAAGQSLYRQVYANAMAVNADFKAVEPVAADQLSYVMSAVYNDHPELFWLDTQYFYTYTSAGGTQAITLAFNSTTDNLTSCKQQYDTELQKVIKGASAYGTDVEKERYVHDYLLQKCTYDLNASLNQSSYSALVNGVSVCAGYARAMQNIMIELGIPCYYCTGTAQGGDHAWNILYLDGDYYHLDLSWNDNISETYDTEAYVYYNLTDSQISTDHTRTDLSIYLPACNGEKDSYVNLYGTSALEDLQNSQYSSYESLGYTSSDIITDMNQYNDYAGNYLISTGKGEQTFTLVLQNKELLDQIYDSIQTQSYAEAYMQNVIDTLGIANSTVRVSLSAKQLQNGYILMQQTTLIQ